MKDEPYIVVVSLELAGHNDGLCWYQ